MSKIPQGEWNAIAARYAQGESMSRIAQTYGCTPPAIHYILKRNKQRTTLTPEQPLSRRQQSQPTGARDTVSEESAARPPTGEGTTGLVGPAEAGRDIRPAQFEQTPPHFSRHRPMNPRYSARGPALSTGLDNDLHGRAEAAIEAFRSSFDAALAEGSPVVRQQLRQAAADLMRVAARTTIVLDQLSAKAER